MALVRVFTPQTLSESAVVVAMLEAHGIPVLRHNGHFASLLPGVQINAYNTQTIMVPDEHAADALELLTEFRRPAPAAPQPRGIARTIFESLLFGWFVPGGNPRHEEPAPLLAKFVDAHEVDEAGHAEYAAPSFAVVIARAPTGVVLVFNRHRKVWELPGGLIDEGETPREAAARELAEESGCIAANLEWLGLVSVHDKATRHGAIFRCEVDALPPHIENEEIGGIAFWRPGSHPRPLGETDGALLRRFG
jgi:ADP-ribose pyrophosphatase YjhB (NUDIX family)